MDRVDVAFVQRTMQHFQCLQWSRREEGRKGDRGRVNGVEIGRGLGVSRWGDQSKAVKGSQGSYLKENWAKASIEQMASKQNSSQNS